MSEKKLLPVPSSSCRLHIKTCLIKCSTAFKHIHDERLLLFLVDHTFGHAWMRYCMQAGQNAGIWSPCHACRRSKSRIFPPPKNRWACSPFSYFLGSLGIRFVKKQITNKNQGHQGMWVGSISLFSCMSLVDELLSIASKLVNYKSDPVWMIQCNCCGIEGKKSISSGVDQQCTEWPSTFGFFWTF